MGRFRECHRLGVEKARPSLSAFVRQLLVAGLAFGPIACANQRMCSAVNAGPAIADSERALKYTVACPDVIELQTHVGGPTTRRFTVDADGTILVAPRTRIRVEGMAVEEIQPRIAAALRRSPSQVRVHVAEYKNRCIYLCGPVRGTERAVSYVGPETVVDFLRRSGALSRDAEPRNVHVVRANVAEGHRPEAFPVDLMAILSRGDNGTNITLQPNDQVYVGESRSSIWTRRLPPWLQFSLTRDSTVPSRADPRVESRIAVRTTSHQSRTP